MSYIGLSYGTQDTLFICQSEIPKDKPFLLKHSSLNRNLYNSKIKRIFEIVWTLVEIIHGLLNRWTLQLDLVCMTGVLERVVSNITVPNFGAL